MQNVNRCDSWNATPGAPLQVLTRFGHSHASAIESVVCSAPRSRCHDRLAERSSGCTNMSSWPQMAVGLSPDSRLKS